MRNLNKRPYWSANMPPKSELPIISALRIFITLAAIAAIVWVMSGCANYAPKTDPRYHVKVSLPNADGTWIHHKNTRVWITQGRRGKVLQVLSE
jgi:hypothetical protein